MQCITVIAERDLLASTLFASGGGNPTSPIDRFREYPRNGGRADKNVKYVIIYPGIIPLFLDRLLRIKIVDKFYSLTEPLLGSLLRDMTFEVPFELSPEELRIVSHFTTSTLILGRSGTGKTTCLVFSLLAQFKARSSISEEEPIRQARIPSAMLTAYLIFPLNA